MHCSIKGVSTTTAYDEMRLFFTSSSTKCWQPSLSSILVASSLLQVALLVQLELVSRWLNRFDCWSDSGTSCSRGDKSLPRKWSPYERNWTLMSKFEQTSWLSDSKLMSR